MNQPPIHIYEEIVAKAAKQEQDDERKVTKRELKSLYLVYYIRTGREN